MGRFNDVRVDLGGRACFAFLEDYGLSVNAKTAVTALKLAHSLKSSQKRIAFFSASSQGGGVAPMRHALLRFFHVVGVNCTWYVWTSSVRKMHTFADCPRRWVPRPKPEVSRITKTMHNILQGTAQPAQRFTSEQQRTVNEWILDNANRFWSFPSGPLAPRSHGGADLVIIDGTFDYW